MIGVVFNPHAGQGKAGKHLRDLQEELERIAPGNWRIASTKGKGDASRLAAEFKEDGAEVVAAAGGDGTLTECLQTIHGSGVPLALLPFGTGNDFGRQIGVRTIEDGVRALVERTIVNVDVGMAGDHLYLDTFACGFDSAVGQRVNEGYRFLSGTSAYLAAVVSTLRTYRAAKIEIKLDDTTWSGQAMLVTVANCRTYGGGLKVAPRASITDGMLDVIVVEAMSPVRFLTQFPKVMRGTHIDLPDVHCWQAKRVVISADPGVCWMTDGELRQMTPVVIEGRWASQPFCVPRSSQHL